MCAHKTKSTFTSYCPEKIVRRDAARHSELLTNQQILTIDLCQEMASTEYDNAVSYAPEFFILGVRSVLCTEALRL